jgi:hypothetical protein
MARFSEQGLKQWHAEKGRKGGQKSKRGAKADSERSTKPWEALGISSNILSQTEKTREKVRPNKLYQISPRRGGILGVTMVNLECSTISA